MKIKTINLMKPLSYYLALNLLMEPSTFSFTLKTHLQPIACLLGGNHTKSEVLFFSRALYSCRITVSQSAFAKACFAILGLE